MDVYTDQNPSWMHWIAPEEFNDSDLFKIVAFYVFHSPCKGLSSMGRSLKEYGWSDPWQKPYYLNRQLLAASTNPKLVISSRTYAMDMELQKADLLNNFPSDYHKERICVHDCQKNQFMSVFHHLRNAFAHCRLNMVDDNGECVFILEDVVPKKNAPKVKVSARMILRKSTLLKWIDIIEGGERQWK